MSTGAILNQKQELSEYVKKADVATSVTSGDNNPVSSGAVYNYTAANLPFQWRLLSSFSGNITSGSPGTINIPADARVLRINYQGTAMYNGIINLIFKGTSSSASSAKFRLYQASNPPQNHFNINQIHWLKDIVFDSGRLGCLINIDETAGSEILYKNETIDVYYDNYTQVQNPSLTLYYLSDSDVGI